MKPLRQPLPKNLIGERVRVARKAMKPRVSQDDLCGRLARLGVPLTQTSLSRLEKGERHVLDHEAAAIAVLLNVSVDWLFEDAVRVYKRRR